MSNKLWGFVMPDLIRYPVRGQFTLDRSLASQRLPPGQARKDVWANYEISSYSQRIKTSRKVELILFLIGSNFFGGNSVLSYEVNMCSEMLEEEDTELGRVQNLENMLSENILCQS